MMSYKDRTYCASPNCKNECGRKLTDADKAAAKAWWLDITRGVSDDAPIAYAYFCGKPKSAKDKLHDVM